MSHGNEILDWFFTHRGGKLPHCPCKHQHRTLDSAVACAKKKKSRFVREVRNGSAVADHEVI